MLPAGVDCIDSPLLNLHLIPKSFLPTILSPSFDYLALGAIAAIPNEDSMVVEVNKLLGCLMLAGIVPPRTMKDFGTGPVVDGEGGREVTDGDKREYCVYALKWIIKVRQYIADSQQGVVALEAPHSTLSSSDSQACSGSGGQDQRSTMRSDAVQGSSNRTPGGLTKRSIKSQGKGGGGGNRSDTTLVPTTSPPPKEACNKKEGSKHGTIESGASFLLLLRLQFKARSGCLGRRL
jgi:hypothetical protein